MRRSHRVGLFEHWLSAAYIYPFRCQLCGQRFRRLQWGVRYPSTVGDRREFERVPVRMPAAVTHGRQREQGTTADLSMEGCAIHVAGTFTMGDVVQVEIFTPDSGRVATVTAVVRSVAPEMVGVHFHGMSADDRERLHRFMADLLPAVDTNVKASSRPMATSNFWLIALILLIGVLTMIVLLPDMSFCTWGMNC